MSTLSNANTIKLIGVAAVALVAMIVVAWGSLFMVLNGGNSPRPFNLQPTEHFRATDCWEKTLLLVKPTTISLDTLDGMGRLCYQEKWYEYKLENAHIERQAYIEQHYMGRIMLWMVVAITISGVFLAALQLYAGFKLAVNSGGAIASDGSIDINAGKISLKSSITGLMILVVSFGFFLVFVERVYLIKESVKPPPKPKDIEQAEQQPLPLPKGIPMDQLAKYPVAQPSVQAASAIGNSTEKKDPKK